MSEALKQDSMFGTVVLGEAIIMHHAGGRYHNVTTLGEAIMMHHAGEAIIMHHDGEAIIIRGVAWIFEVVRRILIVSD